MVSTESGLVDKFMFNAEGGDESKSITVWGLSSGTYKNVDRKFLSYQACKNV